MKEKRDTSKHQKSSKQIKELTATFRNYILLVQIDP